MELTLVDPTIAVELMELMSKGLLTLEGVNIIIEALNKGNIQTTYKVQDTRQEVCAGGAVYTIYLNTYHDESNIEVLAYNFHSVMITYGENEAIKYLTKLVQPAKKQYKRKRRY